MAKFIFFKGTEQGPPLTLVPIRVPLSRDQISLALQSWLANADKEENQERVPVTEQELFAIVQFVVEHRRHYYLASYKPKHRNLAEKTLENILGKRGKPTGATNVRDEDKGRRYLDREDWRPIDETQTDA